MPQPIIYAGMLSGAEPPAGTQVVPLTDTTVGPLLKAWLLVVTNQAFWNAAQGGPVSDADLRNFADKIGVDPIVITQVLNAAQDEAVRDSFGDVSDKWARLVDAGGYDGQACPGNLRVLADAVSG